eukprot:181681_1
MNAFTEELPLLSRKLSHTSSNTTNNDITYLDDNQHGYSIYVSICFALNYSIGAGILGLPFEFYNTGYILSSLMIIFIGLLSYITNMYVVDAIIRAEAITTLIQQHDSCIIPKYEIISNGQYVKERLKNKITSEAIQSNYQIIRNEYQLSELIGIFCGKWCRLGYDISFGVSTLIGLWSYNVLFGVSLARNISIPLISSACNMEQDNQSTDCRALYSIYVLIFWSWTLVITLIDFRHQQWLQVSATIARVIIIFLMVFTSIGLMYSVYYYNGNNYIIFPEYTFTNDISAWNWSGLVYIIAVSSFAFGSQFCVMDVIQPLSYENKQNKQHFIWCSSIIICVIVYIFCGVVISLYYGNNTQSPCTLAWEGFMGFSATDIQPIWAIIVAWFIVLLPAIDIGSAFPLIATTLSNTFEAILLNILVKNKQHQKDINDITNFYESCYHQRYVVIIKITLCTLVSGLALIEWNFELILAISGAFKLLATYVAPCYLEYKSKQFMNEICIDNENINVGNTVNTKKWMSNVWWFCIITGIALIAFVAVFVYTILEFV